MGQDNNHSKILVIEDSEDVQEFFSDALYDFSLTPCLNASSARELLSKNHIH